MDDLAAFLLERIAEDEAVASQWPDTPPSLAPDGLPWRDTSGRAIYAARRRVLAECEAKRRLVEMSQRLVWGNEGEGRRRGACRSGSALRRPPGLPGRVACALT